ncbi:GntR family transcriptional regulator [Sphingomonas sp. FW199]|uniref:GntR family transcriptional regulator n=1 Tax=Sphingomonas sp. FW199 TaxID=3400217 RepID=UPI003CF8A384
MSPAFVLEPTYNALRRRLINGEWMGGHRLEAQKLAEELGVSMTPVRDSLHRLVGEQLVDGLSGQGFKVPMLDEQALTELYFWRATLLAIAIEQRVTTKDNASAVPDFVAETSELGPLIFDAIAMQTGNRELAGAVQSASARLARFRWAETQALSNTGSELERLKSAWRHGSLSALKQAVADYHDRRISAVSSIAEIGNMPRQQERKP